MVRAAHNPSGESDVDRCKEIAANFIDFLDGLIPADERSERARCKNLAVTNIETAAMFAVKALTAEAPPVRPDRARDAAEHGDPKPPAPGVLADGRRFNVTTGEWEHPQ